MKAVVVIFLTLFLTSCAQQYTHETYSDPYGFFSGIWHGILFPLVLFAEIWSWVLNAINFIILAIFGTNGLSNLISLGSMALSEPSFIGRPNSGLMFYYVGYFFGLSAWSGGANSSD